MVRSHQSMNLVGASCLYSPSLVPSCIQRLRANNLNILRFLLCLKSDFHPHYILSCILNICTWKHGSIRVTITSVVLNSCHEKIIILLWRKNTICFLLKMKFWVCPAQAEPCYSEQIISMDRCAFMFFWASDIPWTVASVMNNGHHSGFHQIVAGRFKGCIWQVFRCLCRILLRMLVLSIS